MIPPRHSIPLDYEAEPEAAELRGDWPAFAEDDDSFGFWAWLAMGIGLAMTLFGLGWLAGTVLA